MVRHESVYLVVRSNDGREAEVSEASRTILLRHSGVRPRAVLLLHGLTASPRQFIRYAQDLFARGHNVLVPRYPLHGYRNRLTDALAGLTGEQLRTFALESLEDARTLGDRVTIAGFSAGGTLALWLAEREEADRVVAIAPFLGLPALPDALTSLAMRVALRLPNRFIWWNPVLRERQLPEHGYPRYATHAIARLYEISRDVMQSAASLPPKSRTLALVLNAGEASVSNRAALRLLAGWDRGGANVERVLLRPMPPSHDIIEPESKRELAARVYPTILDAIDPQS
jgi:alpha-beta hydrolase superfamily lysophospholipase